MSAPISSTIIDKTSTHTSMYMDHLITAKMMDQTTQLLNSGELMSLYGIIKFIILLSMSELINVVKEYIKFLSGWVSTNYKTVFAYIPKSKIIFLKIQEYYLRFKRRKIDEHNIAVDNQLTQINDEYKSKTTIIMDVVPHFWNVLYKYCKENSSKCKFADFNTNAIKMKNVTEFDCEKLLGNFEIEFEDNNLLIEQPILYTFANKNGILELVDNKCISGKSIDPTKIKCMCDIVPYKYAKIMEKIHQHSELYLKNKPYFKPAKKGNAFQYPYLFHTNDQHHVHFYNSVDGGGFHSLTNTLHTLYNNIDHPIFTTELCTIVYLMNKLEPNLNPQQIKNLNIFDWRIKFEPSIPFIKNNPVRDNAGVNLNNFMTISTNLKTEFNESFINQFIDDFIKIDEANVAPIKMQHSCVIKSRTEKSCDKLYEDFQKFMSLILSNPATKTLEKGKTHKFKIYRLMVERKIVTEMIDNPAYIQFCEEQKEMIQLQTELENELRSPNINAKDEEKSSDKNMPGKVPANDSSPYRFNSYPRMMLPPKKIAKNIYHDEIITKLISEKSKSFDTLYLRELTLKKFIKVVDDFKNKKDLMEELGITNKLNMLFHGEPGTGKTTTSWAAASYLEKDLYYVKINEKTTCNQLMKIIDYVLKNCVGGGILLLEEIDVMSKVCHRREICKNQTLTESMDTLNIDEPLTLEFLLNVLQGQLTPDGLVVIATTTSLESLDPALYRKGRFDLVEELKLCDHYQISKIFKKIIGREIKPEILRQIPENIYSPVEIITQCSYYIKGDAEDYEILEEYLK